MEAIDVKVKRRRSRFTVATVICMLWVAVGVVISQDPFGGTELAQNTSVNLVVSDGPESRYYQDSGVIASDQYPPFTKKHVVCGITLAGRDDISDCFMLNVAEMIKEIFSAGASIDPNLQESLITAMIADEVVIPFFVDRGWHRMTSVERNQWDWLTNNYGVYDNINQVQAGRVQVNEVIEHILHHVSSGGLRFTFPDAWGISSTSQVYFAMQEAIAKGHYNVAKYDQSDGHYLRIIISEFAYWLIITGWDLYESYAPNGEWTGVRNPTDLQNKLPLAWQLFQDTIPQVMKAPNKTALLFMTSFARGVNTRSLSPNLGLIEGGATVEIRGDFGTIASIEAAEALYTVTFGDVEADFSMDNVPALVAASGSLYVTAPAQAFGEATLVDVTVSERQCGENAAVLEDAYEYVARSFDTAPRSRILR